MTLTVHIAGIIALLTLALLSEMGSEGRRREWEANLHCGRGEGYGAGDCKE